MDKSEVEQAYREHLKITKQKLDSADYVNIDKFVVKLKRRMRGAKFGANDPLLPDEGVVNANE